MKKNQFLLLKLIEECVEVAHRASKQIQFGKNEKQKDQLYTNGARLQSELLDLFVIWKMLEDAGEIPEWTVEEAETNEQNKKAKLQKYLDLSVSLGQLPEIKL
jgi:NTP pyrophosphatase (non-canonical NTP hydrolase)